MIILGNSLRLLSPQWSGKMLFAEEKKKSKLSSIRLSSEAARKEEKMLDSKS